LLGFEHVGGFARAGGAEQITPRRQGQPPIVGPRIIIKPERHPTVTDLEPPVNLGIVGGDPLSLLEIPLYKLFHTLTLLDEDEQ
jgi:hypothetical protein